MVEHILFKKGLREIRENLKQYITVILIAILAVSLFTGIYANWQNFKYKLDTIYTRSNMCDGIIMTSGNSTDLTDYLEKQDIYFEQRLYVTAKMDSYNLNVLTFKADSTLNKPAYMSISTLTTQDVLVDEGFITKTGVQIGDQITVNISNVSSLGLPLDTLDLAFTITGSMTHPEALDNSEYSSNFLYVGEDALKNSLYNYLKTTIYGAFVTEDLVSELLNSTNNEYLLKGANTATILDQVSQDFDVLYALERADLPTNLTIEADVLQAKQLIYIFPVIFYLVAVLIILTSISELINKEQKNIGLLKALGYSNTEILLHYTNIFVILCIIGGVVGIIIGPIIIPNVMNQKYNILYQLPNISTPIFRPFYLVSVIILIAIVYLTAIFALFSILRKVPASSLRGDNSYNMKPTLFDKLPLKKDKFLALKMALRNMKRKVSRTFMVLFGVMGCSALLLCGFGIENTLDNSVNTELTLIPFDVHLYYANDTSYAADLATIPGVVAVDEYTKKDVEIIKDKMISSYIYILPAESNIFVPSYNEDSCLITSKVAEEIGAKVGDEISFIYNGSSYNIMVTDIIDISFSQGIFISRARGLLDIEPTNAWLRTTNIQMNDTILAEALNIAGIYNGLTITQLKNQADDKLSSIRIMTNTIKIFALLLAIVVLYNLALLNFKERIKDIATLKVLGFEVREIAASFLLEILLLTLVGSAIGLVLGYPLMYAVLAINENPLLSYIYHIDVISYVITFVITAGFSVIINLVMSGFVNKVKMVESLKAVD